MEYKGKTLMVLGAGQLQVPILQKAKEKGLRVIVVSPSLEQPGIKYADEIVQLDVKDEENILKAAIQYKIDGITTDQTDLPVRTAAFVAEKMGLPGIGYECGVLFTDKYLQREKCKEIGADTVEYRLTYHVDEAIEFAENYGFPLIIKPIDSQASHGVSKVENMDELRSRYQSAAAFSRRGGVLVEQYIDGIEFPVDSFVIDGKCNLLAIGQYHPFSLDGVFSSYKTLWPANQPDSILNLIKRTNQKIVEGFGLPIGRTHAEYKVVNDKCYLIEVGARGGGSFFSSDDVRFVSGVSSEDFLIDVALGSKEAPKVDKSVTCFCCCTLFFYLPGNGEIVGIAGMDDVLALDFVGRNNLYQVKIGQMTAAVEDKGARYFIVIKADSYNQLDSRIDQIRNLLRIETLTTDGIKRLPIWF